MPSRAGLSAIDLRPPSFNIPCAHYDALSDVEIDEGNQDYMHTESHGIPNCSGGSLPGSPPQIPEDVPDDEVDNHE